MAAFRQGLWGGGETGIA